ncbi:MAG TPA: PIN domain-containing protein [Puia sp.]
MAFKVLLDVNVILDFVLQRKGFESADKLLEWVTLGKIQAFTTTSILHMAAYWLLKEYGNWQTKEILLSLVADVRVIDMEHGTTVHALHSQMPDIEDSLQYYTALHHKLDYVITRDQELIKSAIPVLPACTPEEFIKNNL